MKGTVEKEVTTKDLIKVCEDVHQQGDRMQMAYAWYPDREENLELIYLATMGSKKPFHLWRCQFEKGEDLTSLANISPLLGWYEREISHLFGISFLLHPEPHRLMFYEEKELTIPPMSPDYPSDKLLSFSADMWNLPHIQNPKLQLLPFGPVRAAICESAQFTYYYAGESILHFYQHLFFKHRGMEKRFEGLSLEMGIILAERVSGISSVAHALAYSQAVEIACDCQIPPRAKQWRVILAELERIYNHVQYLGYLCHTTTLKVGEAQGKFLEERFKQLNARVTGSRFLREMITPGGLRREPKLQEIETMLIALQKDTTIYCSNLLETYSHLDRLIGTGILMRKVAHEQGATGPICRASGIKYDFRHDHPYAAYDDISFEVPFLETGDAYARMRVRIMELEESFEIIKKTLKNLVSGPIKIDCTPIPNAEGLGWVESPRGGLFYAVHFDKLGTLARVKIKSPSFSNWCAFPFTVHDTNMMDYAINEASFGLTIAGCAR